MRSPYEEGIFKGYARREEDFIQIKGVLLKIP